MTEQAQGGRVFFSSTGRSLVDEDEIVILSVGVDIGSSTSHLVFSRIVLERLGSPYVLAARETFYESHIFLPPGGVDIGSSTSHLVFSRIVLERLDSRYVVTTRETFYESDTLLTPYT